MQSDFQARFTVLWPAIRIEWLALLRGEPVLSPLGRPETLVFLMDATLMQLASGLRAPEEKVWLRHCTPVGGTVYRHCACGLNPLIKYFTTGELALRAACAPSLPRDIERILECFRTLARHDIDSLCSMCRHPEWSECEARVERRIATN